jgi:hypothetical protein
MVHFRTCSLGVLWVPWLEAAAPLLWIVGVPSRLSFRASSGHLRAAFFGGSPFPWYRKTFLPPVASRNIVSSTYGNMSALKELEIGEHFRFSD